MHLRSDEMNRLSFQSFRKRALFRVRARRLTEEDVQQRAGVIQTREGPATIVPGDYLVRSARDEEYPISPEAFAILYDESSKTPDTEGFALYSPALLVHQAVQITETCSIDSGRGSLFTGQPGDYLVRTVGQKDEYRIVDRRYFEENYESIGDQ